MSVDNKPARRSHWGLYRKPKHKGGLPKSKCGPASGLLELDRAIYTDAAENKKRRTLQVVKEEDQSWGFNIQSREITHKSTGQSDNISYVDLVEAGSPADKAGLREGDAILSINGRSVEDWSHEALIQELRGCIVVMRLVVLYEECSEKIEAALKLRKLKRILAAKLFDLHSLEMQEKHILEGNTSPPETNLRSFASSTSLSEHGAPLGSSALSILQFDWAQSQMDLGQGLTDRLTSTRSMCLPPSASQPTLQRPLSLPPVSPDQLHSSLDATRPVAPARRISRVASTYASLPPRLRGKCSSSDAVRHVGRSTFYSSTSSESESPGFDSTRERWESSQSLVGNSTFYISHEENPDAPDQPLDLTDLSPIRRPSIGSSVETLKNPESDNDDEPKTPITVRLHPGFKVSPKLHLRATGSALGLQTRPLSLAALETSSASSVMDVSTLGDSGFESPVFFDDSCAAAAGVSLRTSHDSGISNCVSLDTPPMQAPIIKNSPRIPSKHLHNSHSATEIGDNDSLSSVDSGTSHSTRLKGLGSKLKGLTSQPLPSRFRLSWEATKSRFRQSFMSLRTRSSYDVSTDSESPTPPAENSPTLPDAWGKSRAMYGSEVDIYGTLPRRSKLRRSPHVEKTHRTAEYRPVVTRAFLTERTVIPFLETIPSEEDSSHIQGSEVTQSEVTQSEVTQSEVTQDVNSTESENSSCLSTADINNSSIQRPASAGRQGAGSNPVKTSRCELESGKTLKALRPHAECVNSANVKSLALSAGCVNQSDVKSVALSDGCVVDIDQEQVKPALVAPPDDKHVNQTVQQQACGGGGSATASRRAEALNKHGISEPVLAKPKNNNMASGVKKTDSSCLKTHETMAEKDAVPDASTQSDSGESSDGAAVDFQNVLQAFDNALEPSDNVPPRKQSKLVEQRVATEPAMKQVVSSNGHHRVVNGKQKPKKTKILFFSNNCTPGAQPMECEDIFVQRENSLCWSFQQLTLKPERPSSPGPSSPRKRKMFVFENLPSGNQGDVSQINLDTKL